MVEDTVSRIFQRMRNATDGGAPLKFYLDTGDFVDMRNVMRDYEYDLNAFHGAYNMYTYQEVVFLYANTSDEENEEMEERIDMFLDSIEKNYNYDITELKEQWVNMTASSAPLLQKFRTMNEFFEPYRGDEIVVPYNNKMMKRSQLQHTSGVALDAITLYHLLKISDRIVFVRYGELVKVHKDRPDVNLSLTVKSEHIYLIYIGDDDNKIELDIDTATNTISYVDIDTTTLCEIFGDDFWFTNERSSRVVGSFITQIQNFDDFTFYCFTNGLVSCSPRLVVSSTNQLSIETGEDDLMAQTKYPVIYMNDFSSPRSLSKSTNKYYLRNFLKDNLTYAMSFQLVNIGVNNYVVNYEIKRQLNAPHAIQFLKTYFNYYEKHALKEDQLQGKQFVESWYGADYPYHTDDKVNAIPSKIANLKLKSQTDDNMFEPETYARNMCDCRNQPIIVDKEDTPHWVQYSDKESDNKPMLFPPVEDDRPNNSKYYVCPTLNKPVIVLKVNKGKNNKKYPYLPCCAETVPSAAITPQNYLDDEGRGPTKTSRQAKSSTPLKQISPTLERFFAQFGNDLVIHNSNTNPSNSFVGCLLQSHRRDLPMRQGIDSFIKNFKRTVEDRTRDRFVEDFRKRCVDMGIVEPCTARQELYDYSNDRITKIIQKGDSSLAYRFFEHLFMVNIVVFYVDSDDVYIKRPRYHQFHVRNPIDELPTLFLHYDRQRYSVIGRKNQYLFNYSIRPLLEPYYLTVTSPRQVTYLNPYQGIIWEKIFKMFQITGQRIGEDGKTYAINLRIANEIVSVYVPPSPPLNVRETREVGEISSEIITQFFGDGRTGNNGLWFSVNKQEVVFVPCADVPKEGKVCPRYVSDKTYANDDYLTHANRMKNANILVELVEWAWKISKLSVSEFFQEYFEVVDKAEIFNLYTDFNVSSIFPNTNTSDFFEWVRQHNTLLQAIIYNGKINVYEKLYTNLYHHMLHLERTDAHPVRQFSITSISTTQNNDITLSFTSADQYNRWQDENQNLHLLDRLENRPIYIYRNDGALFLVKHTNSISEAINFTNKLTSKRDTTYTLYTPDMEVIKGGGILSIIKYDEGFSTLIPLN